MKLVYATLLAVCVLANAAHAAEETQQFVGVPVDLYKAPKSIEMQPPHYPESERQSGRDGWVIVNMMIDTQGKPYEGSSWYYQLLKRRFQIELAIGKIAEIKLRCDRQYVFFPFDPKLQYTISGSDRSCSMEVVGDPGSKFRLIQL